MKTNFGPIVLSAVLLVAASCGTAGRGGASQTALTEYVNPYIGTGGHGHTFLGVTAPFGAVQVGPNNINKGWDWCSGYHYSDSVLVGFAHLHLSGTGCSDTGDLLFMPYTGTLQTQPGSQEHPDEGYASRYSHGSETVRPGYYSLRLDDYDIRAELTASERVAWHRYTFPQQRLSKQVMINLKDANGDDRPVECFMEQTDDYTVRGYRHSTGWSKRQQIYFTARFSQPVKLSLYDDDRLVPALALKSKAVKGNVTLADTARCVQIQVGISPVSMENAAMNISHETQGRHFDGVVEETTGKWEEELRTVSVETPDSTVKTLFYTALYHAFMQPVLYNDVNGDYRGTDRQAYRRAAFDNYTVFSLWDTYRAAHPLYTLLQPERVPHFIRSMLAIYEQQGRLPVWHLYGSDTQEMIGIQSVPVLADAILKDMRGFDYEKAYEAMKNSMLGSYKGLDYVKSRGYIPADCEKESVAKGLEYAIADWGVAQVARKLGKTEDYALFAGRAEGYKYYWDAATCFFRGRNSDGTLTQPFNPVHSTHRADDYCEGNAWQYTWLVPHDVDGLIALFGSEEAFAAKLDSLFRVEEQLGESASPDISGLIGQYAHGNEPGHHTLYLYAYVGQQWKTAEKVREVLRSMYHAAPDGLAGNEDCGQMSAWYVFSALGFYPVNPSGGVYVFGSPLVHEAQINLPDGKVFKVMAENNSPHNCYIQSVEWNGEDYPYSYITHADIMRGGVLKFKMSPEPNRNFGTAPAFRPKQSGHS